MPRKRQKPRRTLRHGLRSVRSPAVELAGLRGGYLAWLQDQGLPPQVDPAELWEDTTAVVDLATDRAGLHDLRAWTVEQVEALAEAADAEDEGPLATLPLLLAFLASTGRWHGTADEFAAVLQAAEKASPSLSDELAAVEVDPATEDAALTTLPVVGQAEALLRFLLPRRKLTGTGGLRRADTVTAAGLLGVELPKPPRSMWDVPRLVIVWAALLDAGLLEVTESEATPTPAGYAWVTGEAEAGREARRLLLRQYLVGLLTAPTEPPWLPSPLESLLPALAAAAAGRPLPTAEVLGQLDDDETDPAVSVLLGLAAQPARDLLERLATDGVLTLSDVVSTPSGLRGVLARAIADLLLATGLAGDEPAAALAPPNPALAGQAWRLRVELDGAQPPIWREVLVDPNLPLDELHEVIQRVFDWEDDHLHAFTATGPGRRTTRLAPLDPDHEPFGPPPRDEAGVRLSEVVGPRRHEPLVYEYDFGDCWEHRITVVGVEPADDALPRCTAGSGAAPAEDSGGVWGWARMVDVAQDPGHPEHADVREWLGLEDGETLDPTAFDPADVDRRLAPLRR